MYSVAVWSRIKWLENIYIDFDQRFLLPFVSSRGYVGEIFYLFYVGLPVYIGV